MAVDSKAARSSRDQVRGVSSLHLVSAWADDRSSEITATRPCSRRWHWRAAS